MVRYGVDLIWWMTDDLIANPLEFWRRVLEDTSNAKFEGIEITGYPSDYYTVQKLFGSKESFKEKLDEYNLKLCAAFLMIFQSPEVARKWGVPVEGLTFGNLADPSTHDKIVVGAEKYAEFLQWFGAEDLIIGPPQRKEFKYVDLKIMSNVAEGLMKIGRKTLDYGVRTSIHTNGFSILKCDRDVDLLMALTDPDYVWLCPDTAQLVVGGGDPIRVIERYKDRISIVHFKDALGPAPKGEEEIPRDKEGRPIRRADGGTRWYYKIGTGVVDFHCIMKILGSMNYNRWIIVEYDRAPNPRQDLIDVKNYIDHVLSKIWK